MNTHNNNPDKVNINSEFEDLFTHSTSEKELEHETRMLSFRFLSEFDRLYGNKRGLRSYLAKETDNSKSYFTQLYNGDKIINLSLVAKLQKLFKVKFKIKAIPENDFEQISHLDIDKYNLNMFVFNKTEEINLSTQDDFKKLSPSTTFIGTNGYYSLQAKEGN